MYSLLWTIPALPLAGFVTLALFGDRIPRSYVSRIAVDFTATAPPKDGERPAE